MSFEQAISQFQPIKAGELSALLTSGQSVVAFIGRVTCPYCQRFAPKLAQAQEATGRLVYFVDSRQTDDPALQTLRAQYDVVTVPGLLIAKEGQVEVFCDSGLSVETLKELLA